MDEVPEAMKRFTFRKFYVQRDLLDIYDIMSTPEEQMQFQEKVPYNSGVEFERWFLNQLNGHFHDFYVIEDTKTRSLVGFVYSYDFRASDGHCMICVYVKPQYRNIGIGALCGLRFLHELFRDYSMRKIYLSIYDYNRQSLLSNLHAGFVEEGCYKAYRFYDGKYWDMHVLAITRDTFYRLHRKTIERL